VTTQVASYLLGSPEREIELISKDAMHPVSEIKLIRTDTTLDLSQKAEKVWVPWDASYSQAQVNLTSLVTGGFSQALSDLKIKF
jgi:hypothetical protein